MAADTGFNPADLRYDHNGLLPAIVQDAETKEVLMLGYISRESLAQTFVTRKATFWSRSRNMLWVKGETSGNFLTVVDVIADCDLDSILILAKPAGPTCHTGAVSCFTKAADEFN